MTEEVGHLYTGLLFLGLPSCFAPIGHDIPIMKPFRYATDRFMSLVAEQTAEISFCIHRALIGRNKSPSLVIFCQADELY